MIRKSKFWAAAGLLPLAALACEIHHHEEPPPPVAYEPVPEHYVYYSNPYYYQGHYDHDYWEWRDPEGRNHREARDEHEQHAREHPRYEHDEHEHDDHH